MLFFIYGNHKAIEQGSGNFIPKKLRDAYHWLAGQELVAIATDDGILLKPKQLFKKTKLADVAGCLLYEGEAKSLAEMDDAICQGVLEQWQ